MPGSENIFNDLDGNKLPSTDWKLDGYLIIRLMENLLQMGSCLENIGHCLML